MPYRCGHGEAVPGVIHRDAVPDVTSKRSPCDEPVTEVSRQTPPRTESRKWWMATLL